MRIQGLTPTRLGSVAPCGAPHPARVANGGAPDSETGHPCPVSASLPAGAKGVAAVPPLGGAPPLSAAPD